MSQAWFGAADIGGTKILTAIVSSSGEIAARGYIPTPTQASPQAVVSQIVHSLGEGGKQAGAQVLAIGLAVAGLVDSRRHLLVTSPHLPQWQDVPLKALVEQATGLNTFIINDATAAALGEYKYGAGQGVENLIYLTVSTGIGGGLVLGGRLYAGGWGFAGEVGHMVIQAQGGPVCDCGRRGCLEALASGSAIARRAREMAWEKSLSLRELAGGSPEKVTAQLVTEAAERGDTLAQEIIQEAAIYLGVGLANLVNIFNPDLIIIGGGLSKMGERLLGPAEKEMRRRAFAPPAEKVRLVPARLGENSGVLGAVAFLLQELAIA